MSEVSLGPSPVLGESGCAAAGYASVAANVRTPVTTAARTRIFRVMSGQATAQRAGSDDQTECEYHDQSGHREDRLHHRPGLEGLPDGHAEVLLHQPETGVVDVGQEHRPGTDRQDDQREFSEPIPSTRPRISDDAVIVATVADPVARWISAASVQANRSTETFAPVAQSASRVPIPVSTRTSLNPPPAETISRMPAIAGRAAPVHF